MCRGLQTRNGGQEKKQARVTFFFLSKQRMLGKVSHRLEQKKPNGYSYICRDMEARSRRREKIKSGSRCIPQKSITSNLLEEMRQVKRLRVNCLSTNVTVYFLFHPALAKLNYFVNIIILILKRNLITVLLNLNSRYLLSQYNAEIK